METLNSRLVTLVKQIVLNYSINNYSVVDADIWGITFKANDIKVRLYFGGTDNHREINYHNNTYYEPETIGISIYSIGEKSTREMSVTFTPVDHAMICEEANKLAREFETNMILRAMVADQDNDEVGEINDLGE